MEGGVVRVEDGLGGRQGGKRGRGGWRLNWSRQGKKEGILL